MSEPRRDEWIRRIQLYLELGSEGIVVLVDRARDALIGELVRALLRKHADLTIVVSPEELREVAPGSVVLYHAEPEDAERLNLIRPVLKDVEAAFAPREHVFEGVLLLLQGRALARLGQPDRAIDELAMAESIVFRTTENERHPWALMARFERVWLLARHRGGSMEAVDAALALLREALWPEHRDLREAEKLRSRL